MIGGDRNGHIVNPDGFPHDQVHVARVEPGTGLLAPWRPQPALPFSVDGAAAFVWKQRLYVAGGRRGPANGRSKFIGSARIGANGDLGTWDFQSHRQLPEGRARLSAVKL